MSLLSPLPYPHAPADETPGSRASLIRCIRARVEVARSLAAALDEVADSGESEENMRQTANFLILNTL